MFWVVSCTSRHIEFKFNTVSSIFHYSIADILLPSVFVIWFFFKDCFFAVMLLLSITWWAVNLGLDNNLIFFFFLISTSLFLIQNALHIRLCLFWLAQITCLGISSSLVILQWLSPCYISIIFILFFRLTVSHFES